MRTFIISYSARIWFFRAVHKNRGVDVLSFLNKHYPTAFAFMRFNPPSNKV